MIHRECKYLKTFQQPKRAIRFYCMETDRIGYNANGYRSARDICHACKSFRTTYSTTPVVKC